VTCRTPSRTRTLTGTARRRGRVPLGGVVEQVGDRAIEPARRGAQEARHRSRGRRACGASADVHDRAHPRRPGQGARPRSPRRRGTHVGEIDEIADEHRQLVQFAPARRRSRGRARARAAKRLPASASRLARCSSAACAARARRRIRAGAEPYANAARCQHRVEADGEPAQLVSLAGLDAMAEVLVRVTRSAARVRRRTGTSAARGPAAQAPRRARSRRDTRRRARARGRESVLSMSVERQRDLPHAGTHGRALGGILTRVPATVASLKNAGRLPAGHPRACACYGSPGPTASERST